MAAVQRSNIVQVSNVSPAATSEQLRTLFGHLGILEEFVIFPNDEKEEVPSKVVYIRYQDPINSEVALHLNNTVFLDRALIVLPLANGLDQIPDEKYANLIRAPAHTAAGVLPRTADWPMDVISMVVGRPGEQVIQTIDPRLSNLAFPLYPPLPATTDGSRIEEIRRTVLVTNLDAKTTGEQVLEFFNDHAEVRCVRMAGTEHDRAAYVEFTQQPSIIKAFSLMGATLNGRQIMVQHSNCAIIKPANNLAMFGDGSKAAPLASSTRPLERSKYRARSRTRSRSKDRRSRSKHRSTSRHKRSRSRDRRRSRSRHSRRRSRTRSRSRGRRRRSRSYSRDYRRSTRGRSRSREKRKYRRSPSRTERRRSSRSRSRARHRDRTRGESRRSRDRHRDSDKKDRDRDRKHEREKDRHKDSKSRRKRQDTDDGAVSDHEEKSEKSKSRTSDASKPHAVRENKSSVNEAKTECSSGVNSDNEKNEQRKMNGTDTERSPASIGNDNLEECKAARSPSDKPVENGSFVKSQSPTNSDSGDAMDTGA